MDERPGMNIGALLHTINVHGGVRRYFEVGNTLIRHGHSFTLFHRVIGERVPWMRFDGNAVPYDLHRGKKFDAMITGAHECFNDLVRSDATVKIVLVVAKFYADRYKRLWKEFGNSLLWIGVSGNWNEGMEEIEGITIPGGVDTEFFKPIERAEEDKLTVSFYCRTGSGRNVDQILDVAKECQDVATFIGYDSENGRPSLEHAPGVEIRKMKNQEEMLRLLQNSDIILSGMRTAGWNNVISEAMACGAVSVTTSAGCEDLVQNLMTGCICYNEDFRSEMIGWIRALARNRKKLGMIRRNAIQHVQQFSWDKHVAKILEEVKKRI